MTRRTMTAKRRAEVFASASGVCHICQGKIAVGEAWQVEHVIPLALGGDDDGDNLQPAHTKCHRAKTSLDVTQIARAKRLHERHTGARIRKGTMPGSRASKFKRRMDGTVEIRS